MIFFVLLESVYPQYPHNLNMILYMHNLIYKDATVDTCMHLWRRIGCEAQCWILSHLAPREGRKRKRA